MKNALLILTIALSASSLVLGAAGCSDDTSSTGGGGSGAGTGDVIYEAEATDEALEALLEAPVIDDAAEEAYITSPVDGDALEASVSPTFEWRVGPAETGSLREPDAAERLGLAPRWRATNASVLSAVAPALFGMFGPAQSAHAHGTPVNGRGYLLVIDDAAGTPIHRVFTLALEHTPSQAAWEAMAAAEGPLRASVLNAVFESNKVVEQGGPYEGPAITFTIE